MVAIERLTYHDYMQTSDDEAYELLDGVLIDVPSRDMPHQSCQSRLFGRMVVFVCDRKLGVMLLARTDVVLSKYDIVQPDILFVSKARRHIIGELNIKGAPDLVVEILTSETARRDWQEKRELYAFHGVKEYWIADPANRVVWVMLTKNGKMEIHRTYGIGDTLSSPTLEGFTVSIDDIFDDKFIWVRREN